MLVTKHTTVQNHPKPVTTKISYNHPKPPATSNNQLNPTITTQNPSQPPKISHNHPKPPKAS